MSERSEQFTVADAGRLEVRLGSGSVRVVPGTPGVIGLTISGADTALARVTLEQQADTVVIEATGKGRRWSRLDVLAVVPEGIEIDAKLGGGGDVTVDQAAGSVRIAIGAGDVRVRRVLGDATIKAAAGDITLGTVLGRLDTSGASGDLRVDAVHGELTASVASGDIRIGHLMGSAAVRTASGDISIERFEGSRIAVKTLSGDVALGIPAGRTLEVDLQSLSGRVENRLEPDPDVARTGLARIDVKSVSGDVILRPAGG